MFLLAVGPLFGISKLIGEKRTRRVEEWLLRAFTATLAATRMRWTLPLAFASLALGRTSCNTGLKLTEQAAPRYADVSKLPLKHMFFGSFSERLSYE